MSDEKNRGPGFDFHASGFRKRVLLQGAVYLRRRGPVGEDPRKTRTTRKQKFLEVRGNRPSVIVLLKRFPVAEGISFVSLTGYWKIQKNSVQLRYGQRAFEGSQCDRKHCISAEDISLRFTGDEYRG